MHEGGHTAATPVYREVAFLTAVIDGGGSAVHSVARIPRLYHEAGRPVA